MKFNLNYLNTVSVSRDMRRRFSSIKEEHLIKKPFLKGELLQFDLRGSLEKPDEVFIRTTLKTKLKKESTFYNKKLELHQRLIPMYSFIRTNMHIWWDTQFLKQASNNGFNQYDPGRIFSTEFQTQEGDLRSFETGQDEELDSVLGHIVVSGKSPFYTNIMTDGSTFCLQECDIWVPYYEQADMINVDSQILHFNARIFKVED